MSYAPPGFESKICPPAQLTARAELLTRPLVFTNGCFDILHRGHVTYLAQARALGASLIVAVNSDASVRRWQERITPWWKKIAGGCHLARDIPSLLHEAGFECPDLKAMYLPGPRTLTYNYWGIAFASTERGR